MNTTTKPSAGAMKAAHKLEHVFSIGTFTSYTDIGPAEFTRASAEEVARIIDDNGMREMAEAHCMDKPLSLPDAIACLVLAANHLLDDHSCDRDGYEKVRLAANTATEQLPKLRAALARYHGKEGQ